jgi:sugar lactone lactonase YvrE
MKIVLRIVLLLIVALFIYLLFYPVNINPTAWNPPAAPSMEEGTFKKNDALAKIKKITVEGIGPEDLAFDSIGRIYTGLENGKIIQMNLDGSNQKVFADTKGRPLGFRFDAKQNLIVADAFKGLLSIDPTGKIEVLTDGYQQYKFHFADDLDIASDGKIYFSDASSKFTIKELTDYSMEAGATGKLFVYDPQTKKTELLVDSLYFANGVTFSPDESFVLVNETMRYRITRYWLKGEKKGKKDIFIDNLPGFPDGILWNGKDTYWLSLANPRNKTLDDLAPYPLLKKVLRRFPESMLPKPIPYGFALGLDSEGKVTYNLQDINQHFGTLTNAVERDGKLYFGSLAEKAIGVMDIPAKK